jgi:hypothetical protein
MSPRRKQIALVASLLALTLFAAAQARPSARSASWSWQAALPGDSADAALRAAAASAGADAASVRELAAADGFTLLAGRASGTLVVGPATADGAQLEPLAIAAAGTPLLVYAAATPDGGVQELVGVARADVDEVDAVLADGSRQPLPLNQWRGFDYVATTADNAAVSLIATASGTSIGAVRVPQTNAQAAPAATQPVYGLFRTSPRDQTLVLAKVDPRTLQATAGPRLALHAQWVNFMALSPDGRQLVLAATPPLASGHSATGERLLRADLGSMKLLSNRWIGDSSGEIRTISWPVADRLIEIRQFMSKPYQRNVVRRTAWIVDPASGRGFVERTLTNKLAIRSAASTPLGLVLLLGSSGLHGRTMQLDLVSPNGALRTRELAVGATKNVTRPAALAVNGTAGHAYVVVDGGTVFDVDLHTMTVAKQLVSPPAGAPTAPPPIGVLHAQLVAGKIAVAGLFHQQQSPRLLTQGVYLIDPSSWQTQTVDTTASMFTASATGCSPSASARCRAERRTPHSSNAGTDSPSTTPAAT